MKYFLSLLALFAYYSVYSQKTVGGIELKMKYGFLIAHRPIMNHLPKDHTHALEATYFFQTKGTKDWHLAYKFPKAGVSMLFTDAGNNDVLGKYGGIYSFLEYPFLNGKKARLYGKIGCGVGFTNKVFDQKNNPKNVAVSTHVNALINFGLFFQYHFKQAHLTAGLDLTHFSNAAIKLPNLGLNLPYLCIGYGRFLKPVETRIETQAFTKPVFQRKPWSFSLIGIFSFRDYYPTGNKHKQVYALNLSAQKVFKWGVGYELGFDLIYKPTIRYYKPVITKSDETIFQTGFYNAYILTLNRLQMVVGMGVYIRDEYFPDDRFYHRIGLRYRVKDRLRLNLTLKSHWAKADYLEYGIGYTL